MAGSSSRPSATRARSARACSRVIVVGGAYDEFAGAACVEAVAQPGRRPAARPGHLRVGPVISAEAQQQDRGLHRGRQARGARLLVAGRRRRLAGDGYLRRARTSSSTCAPDAVIAQRRSSARCSRLPRRATSTRRWRSPTDSQLRADRRPLLAATRATSSGRAASSASATSTSTARSPAPSSAASRSAASRCPASATRPAGRTTCCSSWSREHHREHHAPRLRAARRLLETVEQRRTTTRAVPSPPGRDAAVREHDRRRHILAHARAACGQRRRIQP